MSARSRGSLSRMRSTMLQPTVSRRTNNDAYVMRVTKNGPGLGFSFCPSAWRTLRTRSKRRGSMAIYGPLIKLSGIGVTSRSGGLELPQRHRAHMVTALLHMRTHACFEPLNNVARHANATRIDVRLRADNGSARLEVRDDGQGMAEGDLSESKSLGSSACARWRTGGEVSIYSVPTTVRRSS